MISIIWYFYHYNKWDILKMAGCHFSDHPTCDCNAFLFLTLRKTAGYQEGPSTKELKADFGQETESLIQQPMKN